MPDAAPVRHTRLCNPPNHSLLWPSLCIVSLVKLLILLKCVCLVPQVSAVPATSNFGEFKNLPSSSSGNLDSDPLVQNQAFDLYLKPRQDDPYGAQNFDVVILGGTPGGVTAAISASRILVSQNKPVRILILERNDHIGGLPANGLGATDIRTRGATGGLFLEFVQRVLDYYSASYGANSKQVKDCSDGYHFEPQVAEKIMEDMIAGEGDRITVLKRRQFDADSGNLVVNQQSQSISSLTVTNRDTGAAETYSAKYFIDATYEGDLIGAAQVPFFLGREAREVYNEIGAGKVYKYWGGPEANGTTYEGDDAIQAYNYRLCLTKNPKNMVPFSEPKNYNRAEYVSIIRDIITGCHTGIEAWDFCPGGQAPIPNGDWYDHPPRPVARGTPRGINRLTNMVALPNGKVDANNQHLAFLSTDLPEENWAYPTSSWEWRDQFAERLRSYTEGLFYFAQNDEEVPPWFRVYLKKWGYAKDEYQDNGYFPRQIYVREGRRMKGRYIFTSNDALSSNIHSDTITASHYALDSHGVRKRESDRVNLDGFVSYDVPKPYTVPYGVIVPSTTDTGLQLNNLLAPVPVSGSHIGYSTLRMEPCWMALGQAAGTVAGLLLDGGGDGSVVQIDIKELQNSLLDQGAILVWESELDGKNVQQRKALQLVWLSGLREQNPTDNAQWTENVHGSKFKDELVDHGLSWAFSLVGFLGIAILVYLLLKFRFRRTRKG